MSAQGLSGAEIDLCRKTFIRFDKDRSGTIDLWELKSMLESMGQAPTEEELFRMIAEVDDNMSGSIDFPEFMRAIEAQKRHQKTNSTEEDTLEAFVACGGNPDRSGGVQTERLIKIVKEDFALEIDIEGLLEDLDKDRSGTVDFEEFSKIFVPK